MFRAQAESVAVSGLHAVGSSTVDLKPLNKRNVVETGSGSESLELSSIDSAGHQTLILVWTLQMGTTDCQWQVPASGHSNPHTVQQAPVFSLFANGTLRA